MVIIISVFGYTIVLPVVIMAFLSDETMITIISILSLINILLLVIMAVLIRWADGDYHFRSHVCLSSSCCWSSWRSWSGETMVSIIAHLCSIIVLLLSSCYCHKVRRWCHHRHPKLDHRPASRHHDRWKDHQHRHGDLHRRPAPHDEWPGT